MPLVVNPPCFYPQVRWTKVLYFHEARLFDGTTKHDSAFVLMSRFSRAQISLLRTTQARRLKRNLIRICSYLLDRQSAAVLKLGAIKSSRMGGWRPSQADPLRGLFYFPSPSLAEGTLCTQSGCMCLDTVSCLGLWRRLLSGLCEHYCRIC